MPESNACIVIIQTGHPPREVVDRHGDFSTMIRTMAGQTPAPVEVVAVHDGELLQEPGRYRAAVITGSPAMVTDQAAWSERTASWIRRAFESGLPMLGICYGHQLLAHALGGKVGYHPQGRQVGTGITRLLHAGAATPLFDGFPSTFEAHLIHQQSVLEPPAGATVLARSDSDPHQVLRYSPHVFSTQYHPEFSAAVMRTYLACFAPALLREGFDIETLQGAIHDTPHAQRLLQRFVERYAAGTTTGSASSSTP